MIAKVNFSDNGKSYFKGYSVPDEVAARYPKLVEEGEKKKDPEPEKKNEVKLNVTEKVKKGK